MDLEPDHPHLPHELADHDHEGHADAPDGLSLLSKKGYHALKEGHFAEAIASFEELLEREPKNSYALVGLGDVCRKKGDYEKATAYYHECLRQNPDNNYALFGLADAYKALGLFHKALEIWEKYLVHDSGNITVLTRVADAYRKVRNFRGSKETYQKVLALDPHNAYALIGLGHLFYDFKDYREAQRSWETMEKLNPSGADIRVLTSLGNCHRKLKTYREGIPYFQRVLAEHPDNFYALFGMADCYRGLNQSEESLDHWNKILAFDPSNKVILTRAGDSLRALGRYEEAEDHYQSALDIEYDLYAVLGIALVRKERHQYREALQTLNGILRNDAGNPRLYQEMAECYLALGERHEAKAILEVFQKRGLKNPYIADMLAHLR